MHFFKKKWLIPMHIAKLKVKNWARAVERW